MESKNIHVAANAEEAAKACAAFALEKLAQAIQKRSKATIAISGGTTPRLLFQDFAQSGFDWSKVHVYWVDERCVPPTDAQSNFRLAQESWLHPADVPPANVHRIHGELTPDEAAIHYIGETEKSFGLRPGQLPEFDLIHRGMGPDAHTASLFPGEPLIHNETGLAAAVWVEKMKSHRVTLLPGVLKKARTTILQISGADKADAVKEVLHGAEDPVRFPCQIAARGSDRAHWFFDQAAAAKL